MNDFKDLGITVETKGFTGDKMKIERILNREIIVEDYKIEPSKFIEKGLTNRLCIQFKIGESQHILFTSSIVLTETLKKISKDKFPFKTTIVRQDQRFEFT